MVQQKIITNLKYRHFQKGNDKDGNPLWVCSVSAELYKCYGDNYKINIKKGTPHPSKLEARKCAAMTLYAEIISKYMYVC